ncbi:hypothetical protein [Hymenobacter sp. BRD67]|uniref:hypothetical protein n=1 Tax=Hymenobacter sp. BRD67 TaxID=2675877 RepID=UPI00156603E7|nr:hypothetical protein [Hymenobacter sp. BRD67]QKG53106.1 hypothetical protein GKZ67_11475 [Hymenobacter sp. BRD67]
MKIIFLPLLVLLPLSIFAQGAPATERLPETTQSLSSLLGGSNKMTGLANRDEVALGSPLLFSDWRLGEVLLRGNQRPIAVPLKYDEYRQELRARLPQGDSVAVPMGKVQEFRVLNPAPTRHFVNYLSAPPDSPGTCAEVLVEGPNAQLVKFWHKSLVAQQAPGSTYAATTTVNTLVEQSNYYLRWVSNDKFSPLRLKQASLEQVLTAYPAALAALKARKGRLSSEADLIHAVTELEPLLSAPSH